MAKRKTAETAATEEVKKEATTETVKKTTTRKTTTKKTRDDVGLAGVGGASLHHLDVW